MVDFEDKGMCDIVAGVKRPHYRGGGRIGEKGSELDSMRIKLWLSVIR